MKINPDLNTKPREDEVVCWKIYMKELFRLEEITEEEFKELYLLNFRYDKLNTIRHWEIFNSILAMVDADINSKDSNSLGRIVKKDLSFILDGEIPQNFGKIWITYLYECLNDELISEHDYNFYKTIDVESENQTDKNIIKKILNILRMKLVQKHPEMVSQINDPSFEVLMAANKVI